MENVIKVNWDREVFKGCVKEELVLMFLFLVTVPVVELEEVEQAVQGAAQGGTVEA